MKYPILREFGVYRHLRVPLWGPVFRLAKPVLACFPKSMRFPGLSVRTLRVPCGERKVSVYVMCPKGEEPFPAMLYLHGGGFVFRAAPHHYRLAEEYARRARRTVLFLDYSLAFETSPDAPMSECEAVYREISEHAEELGICGEAPVVAGDSAGAYLALSLTARCRDAGLPLPEKLLLIYPVADPAMTSDSMQRFPDTPMWNARCNAAMWKLYSRGRTPYDPFGDDLSAFPPTYLETAQFDCLHDEGVRLARALSAAGVPCVLNETEGTMHGFDIRKSAPTVRAAMDRRIAFLTEKA